MKKMLLSIICLFAIMYLAMPLCAGAHYIVGAVNDALDGTQSNGKTVVLWKGENILDNVTDTVGPSGNSNSDNIYMIDCELLQEPCEIGEIVNARVINNGDNYLSLNISLIVTGAGYDLMQNITLNSPPNFSYISVDDDIFEPNYEIDLFAGTTRNITCSSIVYDLDGEDSIINISSEFFNVIDSGFGRNDANNNHYTNNSCFIEKSYGNFNEINVTCSFNIWYYSTPGSWNCTIRAEDNVSISTNKSGNTTLNTLLAIEVLSPINFGKFNPESISNESVVNITNFGNVKINLSLYSYAIYEGDNLSMNCSSIEKKVNISSFNLGYNLSMSNPGNLDAVSFRNLYFNMSGNPKTRKFNLDYRKNDEQNDAFNSTYWRMYLPRNALGNCTGKIVLGARMEAEN
ncbi:MAG: hypothetical protein ACP5OG_05585 [Candidatus Nanoarchaeia archaeon]